MIKDVRRFKNDVQCKTCHDLVWKDAESTYYVNGICRHCRQYLPYYIKENQEVRYLLARRKVRKRMVDGRY
jgi:hypothetical protein